MGVVAEHKFETVPETNPMGCLQFLYQKNKFLNQELLNNDKFIT